MSVFYGVRLSDELSGKIEATGRGKSEVISEAVGAYFALDAIGASGCKANVETIQPVAKRGTAKASKPLVVSPRAVESPAVEPTPGKTSGCAKHPAGVGWPKGGGWWCVECGRIV